jgi:hypothetical protein
MLLVAGNICVCSGALDVAGREHVKKIALIAASLMNCEEVTTPSGSIGIGNNERRSDSVRYPGEEKNP